MNVVIHANDKHIVTDFADISKEMKETINSTTLGGPKRTKVVFKNHDTGEILGEYHNKVVVAGSQTQAMNMFGVDKDVMLPSYNTEMELDNSQPDSTEPANVPRVCLFCVSDNGCGTTPKDIYVSSVKDRVHPANLYDEQTGTINQITDPDQFTSDMIMPFRYVDVANDLNSDLRKYYFGRKEFVFPGGTKVGYYFKTFDTEPQLHIMYTDGTQVNDNMYHDNNTLDIECYVEMRLRITRLDFRDYFENALGWDKARISTVSLCSAWYSDEGQYRWYNDIQPYSLLNFSYRPLADSTTAIDIIYSVYY